MSQKRLTRRRIDQLLDFLPLFENPGPATEAKWVLSTRNPETGTYNFPYPTYPRKVEKFFRLASEEWWNAYGYTPEVAGELLESDEAIASASMDEVKWMLTACVRGERFSDGWWEHLIRNGRIARILKRLSELRETVK